MKSISVLLYATVAASSAVAQLVPSLPSGLLGDGLLNPSLSLECKLATFRAVASLASSCVDMTALTNASNVLQQKGNTTTVDANLAVTFLESGKVIDSICDKKCIDAGDKFQKDLEGVCGTNVLISRSLVAENTTAPMNAANINNYLKFINTIACIKADGSSKYCLVDIMSQLAKASPNVTVETATSQFARDTNFSCSSCAKKITSAAANATTWVDYPRFKPVLDEAANVSSKCPGASPGSNNPSNKPNSAFSIAWPMYLAAGSAVAISMFFL